MGALPIVGVDPAEVFAPDFFAPGWMPVAFVAAVLVIGEEGEQVVFYTDRETPFPMMRGLAEMLRDRLMVDDAVQEVRDAS